MKPASRSVAANDRAESAPHRRMSHRSLQGLRVLVVDDDRVPRKVVAHAVTSAGGEPIEAEDGAAGLAVFNTAPRPVDAVVVDYLMPGLDGVDLVRLVRTLGFTGPIIGLSGTASEAQVNAWILAGCDRVMEKGLSMAKLVAELAAVHQRRRRQNAFRHSPVE